MTTVSILAKGTAWMLISAILIKFLAWMYYVIIARMITPGEIGSFYLVLSVINLVLIFSNLGLGGNAVVRYIPYYAGKKFFNHVRDVMKISTVIGTVFSTLFVIIVLVFSNDISLLLHDENLAAIFQIMAFYLLVSNFYSLVSSFLQGRKKLKLTAYMAAFQSAGKLLITVMLLYVVGFNAKSIALGFLLSFLFAAFVGFFWASKEYRSLPHSEEASDRITLLKALVPFGLTAAAITSLWEIMAYTDRIMIGYFLPSGTAMELIGIYSIALGFCSVMTIFVGSIGGITLPMVSEAYGRGDTTEIREVVQIAIRWITLLTFPVLIFILLFPKQILGLVYGPSYVTGYMTMMIYACGTFVLALSSPFHYVLEAIRRLDIIIKVSLVGAVLNVALNYLLIPQYSIEGAAFASAVSYLITTIMLFIYANRLIKVGLPDLSKVMLSAALTAALLIIAGPYSTELSTALANMIPPAYGWLIKVAVLGLLSIVTALVYFVLLIFLRAFVKEDVTIIKGAMRRLNTPEDWIVLAERLFGANG